MHGLLADARPVAREVLEQILQRGQLGREDIIAILSTRDAEDVDLIRKAAEQTLLEHCSDSVYYRGLIEFSNLCAMDCHYCGIRRGNTNVERYTLSIDEIVEAAKWCADSGYGSVVLQSGERSDPAFVDFVEVALRAIKAATVSEKLPQGAGITLSVGEQTLETYERFYSAGAHRYLLRVETTNPELFVKIHPTGQTLANRLNCLRMLKETGFQVGTGVMIGIPGQTIEMLADDLLFFSNIDCDMIGMGPYIVHSDTPLKDEFERDPLDKRDAMRISLLMIGAARLLMKDINMAATTALQAIDPLGREKALRFGANIIMPQVTPGKYRKNYLLYEGKPCVDEEKGDCLVCLAMRIKSVGRKIGQDDWGDSRHALEKSPQR